MGETQSPPKRLRSRQCMFVLYPESQETSIKYAQENFPCAWALHDKDVHTEKAYQAYIEKNGEPPEWQPGDLKKPHIHFVCSFPNARYFSGIARDLGVPVNTIRKVNNLYKAYVYDTVTNNYYYITYEAPSPSPSPSPSPEPSETPAPTPAPGGDTGDTSSLLDVLIEIKDNMIQGFADLKATLVQGWADLSANFTLAIENLNLNITNIFNKKFPDQSTPDTPLPSPTPSLSPEPVDPILPETQNLIIPKMNSNTFADEHGTWVASGSSKYSDVFDFFHAFDRSTSDFWETNVSPSYLQIEIPDPENYYIDGYIMRISKFDNRYPKDWTLQGSDDGNTWDDLDKQTGQNLSDKEEHKYLPKNQ